tara:strand:- start:364 stop:531 length:168 start_codon:yes stop_codon:yes gene_type:complete
MELYSWNQLMSAWAEGWLSLKSSHLIALDGLDNKGWKRIIVVSPAVAVAVGVVLH